MYQGGPQWRVSSPTRGRSILMISAPRSPKICVHHGPASTRVRSRTRRPANGPLKPEISVAALRRERGDPGADQGDTLSVGSTAANFRHHHARLDRSHAIEHDGMIGFTGHDVHQAPARGAARRDRSLADAIVN